MTDANARLVRDLKIGFALSLTVMVIGAGVFSLCYWGITTNNIAASAIATVIVMAIVYYSSALVLAKRANPT